MRTVVGDCLNCESTYMINYEEELVSEELPEMCPFCGEKAQDISESQYIEDDDSDTDDDEWKN